MNKYEDMLQLISHTNSWTEELLCETLLSCISRFLHFALVDGRNEEETRAECVFDVEYIWLVQFATFERAAVAVYSATEGQLEAGGFMMFVSSQWYTKWILMRETESKQNMLMKTPQGALSPRDTLIPTPDFTAARLANLRMHGLPGARNVKQEWKKKKKKKAFFERI